MQKVIATDQLGCILIFYGTKRNKLYIQPNYAGIDEPLIQEVDDGSKLAKAKLEEWKKAGLIKFVKDENKPVTKAELIKYANEKFDVDWDEKTYKKKKVVELEALIAELENPSDDESDEQDESDDE